ncbi:MAG: apolipoprotein N-acyltransferase [Pirellula sp.]
MNVANKIFFWAAVGSLLYWMSLPPLRLPWAAYLACACWVVIVAKKSPLTRREYWSIWIAGSVMWLALLQGIRLAFWPLYAGWVALSLYLAVYLPLFVSLARSLHHEFRFPLPVAAATAWVGCELIRAYFATGFAACMLAHSQTPWPWMLPIASQLGGYGVSYIVMFIGALLFQWTTWVVRKSNNNSAGTSDTISLAACVAFSCVAMGVVVGSALYLSSYEQWIAAQEPIKPLGRILIIQENMPTMFDVDYEDKKLGWERYEQQTLIGARAARSKGVDLVLWPESTFGGASSWFDWDSSSAVPPEFGVTDVEFGNILAKIKRDHAYKLNRLNAAFESSPPFWLVGTDTEKIRAGKRSRYNSALWLDPNKPGEAQYYTKQHLVMFGEYIPILSWFPELLAGFGMGVLSTSDEVPSWLLPSGAVLSTTICFEDVLPHVVRSRIVTQTANGYLPDLLVNITNDGWFRGSSVLDHHLNNAILAAVENRRPMLVAANSGISAWIDGNGRVIRSIPRLEGGSILAEPNPDGRWGYWQSVGDGPARLLALICLIPMMSWFARRFRTITLGQRTVTTRIKPVA